MIPKCVAFSCFLNLKFISPAKVEYIEDIKRNMMRQFHTILKENFQRCFFKWRTHWNKCVECQGDYFEEN